MASSCGAADVCDDARVTRPDPLSILPCMLLDASVVRDIADALDGRWHPDTEANPLLRERLVAAARLRLYSSRSRAGWYVVTYREARASAMPRGQTDWSVGFLPDLSKFEDGPTEADVQALARIHLESGMEAEAGLALAYAVLHEPTRALVTVEPMRYRHGREFDLPARLEIMSMTEAFDRFPIVPGERENHVPPATSPVAGADWWVP